MAAKQNIPEGMVNAMPNITGAELEASRAATKAMPSWGEIKSAFGEKAVTDKKINLDMNTREGRANRGKLLDMMVPAWRKEAHRGQEFSKNTEVTYLRDKQGRRKVAPVEMADRMARAQNLVPDSGLRFGPPRGGWPVFDKNGKVIG